MGSALLESATMTVLVWIGTITFAVTGALRAVEKRFDLVGVFVTAGAEDARRARKFGRGKWPRRPAR